MQQEILIKHEELNSSPSPKKGGPINRLNDLSYKDWMKYQKSFLPLTNNKEVLFQSVSFFTKEIWDNKSPSRSLVVALEEAEPNMFKDRRIIEFISEPNNSIESILYGFSKKTNEKKSYDFIIVDLRGLITNTNELNIFLDVHKDSFFSKLKELLIPDRYCQILISQNDNKGVGFPIPWSIAQASRKFLRLRDEKIGIDKTNGKVDYFLFFQNSEERVFSRFVYPKSINYLKSGAVVPNFVFPKSPPRKKNEISHPAKFPENLIVEFIELFTKKGDNVFDPMVGTGSTILAANRCGRNAFGIDLNPDFIKIAKERIDNGRLPVLFDEYKSNVEGVVYKGDAKEISNMEPLKNILFNYIVTSPPYWSMLNNPGSENQRKRKDKGLALVYSADSNDLGNVEDYDLFLTSLSEIYNSLSKKLKVNGKLTVIVKNVKRNHILYPLAWDIVELLCSRNGNYCYIGTTLWCQDDIPLKPFAVGTHWVSNILHQYCLHFQVKKQG